LGEWRPWREVDWAQQACVLQVDDAAPWVRRGSHPLGQPAWLLPIWLRHLTRHGATVPAGSIVTTGSWTGLTPVRPGSTVRVSFEGIGQAALRL
jgi:2-keto-4-pentenoate hydratase